MAFPYTTTNLIAAQAVSNSASAIPASSSMRFRILSLVFLGSSGFASGSLQAATTRAASTFIAPQPLYFEVNRGQAEDSTRFVARNGNAVFSLSPVETLITVRKRGSSTGQAHGRAVEQRLSLPTRTVRLRLLGANLNAK